MTVLPEVLNCEEFVNADEIAKGLSPFHPEEMAIEAGRLKLKRIETLLKEHKSFSIETTLATLINRLLKRQRREVTELRYCFFGFRLRKWLSDALQCVSHQEDTIFLKM